MALVIVPADQFVILGIEVGQRNFVISSLVPQIDLDVVGGLIAGIPFHDPAGAQLIHHHWGKLDHRVDFFAVGGFANGHAARDDRVLDRSGIGDLLAVDIADIVGTGGKVINDIACHAAYIVAHLFQHVGSQPVGAAGELVPGGADDAAIHQTIQHIAGAGQQDVAHIQRGLLGFLVVILGGRGHACQRRACRRGRGNFLVDFLVDLAARIIGGCLNAIQCRVLPQIARHVAEDEAVDLAFFIGGIIFDVRAAQSNPR